jgi:hypothetical protein
MCSHVHPGRVGVNHHIPEETSDGPDCTPVLASREDERASCCSVGVTSSLLIEGDAKGLREASLYAAPCWQMGVLLLAALRVIGRRMQFRAD